MTLKVGLVPMETTFIGQELLTLPVPPGWWTMGDGGGWWVVVVDGG